MRLPIEVAFESRTAAMKVASRPLYEIAREIARDWKDIYFGARPYLAAMSQLESVDDYYGADSGDMIVRYFLSNATRWRGPVAKAIKAELNLLLKGGGSRPRYARFEEGDTAGFEKWLKTQPKSVQDDWAANKEKYGNKFKTAGYSVTQRLQMVKNGIDDILSDSDYYLGYVSVSDYSQGSAALLKASKYIGDLIKALTE